MLALSLAVVAGTGAVAVADPGGPSADDVAGARQALADAQASAADIEVRLAQLSVVRDEADVRVQQAAEDYAGAQQALADAQTAAQAARARADEANVAAEKARRALVAIALQSARSGGQMDTVEAFLSADGFQDVAERSAALSRMGSRADAVVQQYRAAQLVATTLGQRADQAAADQQQAAQAAQQSLQTAQAAQAESDAAVAAATTERSQLIGRLAAARSTSIQVEQARQDALDAQRRERADAAARAERLAAPVGPVVPAGAPVTGNPGTSAPAAPAAPPAPPAPPAPAPVPAPPAPAPAPTTPAAPPTTPPPATGGWRSSAAQGGQAATWAQTQLGLPYLLGASGPAEYDCSGLTMRAWEAAGIGISRTSRDQYRTATKIAYADLRPGDLVFWGTDTSDPSSIYHVAMWLGGNQIVEATVPGQPVRISSMRWSGSMPLAGRP